MKRTKILVELTKDDITFWDGGEERKIVAYAWKAESFERWTVSRDYDNTYKSRYASFAALWASVEAKLGPIEITMFYID